MSMIKIFAAVGLAVAAVGATAPAQADRYDHDRRWDHDRRDDRRWHNERRWDRHHNNRVRCWNEWHHHHRVRVCR